MQKLMNYIPLFMLFAIISCTPETDLANSDKGSLNVEPYELVTADCDCEIEITNPNSYPIVVELYIKKCTNPSGCDYCNIISTQLIQPGNTYKKTFTEDPWYQTGIPADFTMAVSAIGVEEGCATVEYDLTCGANTLSKTKIFPVTNSSITQMFIAKFSDPDDCELVEYWECYECGGPSPGSTCASNCWISI
jgi:hypothetical protein